MQLGPFYVTPSVQIRDVGVDTNVYDTPVSPRHDFTATFVPHADVWVPFANRALLTTSTGVGFAYYAKYDNARSVDPDVLVRGDVYARRTTFYAGDHYLKTRDRSLEVDAGLARRTENTADGGALVKIGTRFTADIGGYHRTQQYDENPIFGTNLRESLDRTEQGFRFTLNRKLTPLTTIYVRTETQQTRFDFSPVRDTDGFRIAPGANFNPKALINGSAEVGYRRFTGKDPALPDFSGLVARLSLNCTLLETTQFRATWDRDAIYSFDLLWPYATLNAVGGRVRRQIRGQVDAIVSAVRATYDYENFNTSIEQPKRRDVTVSYTVDVGYRLNRDMRIGFAVTSWNRQSNDFVRGYTDLRAGMSFSYTLPG